MATVIDELIVRLGLDPKQFDQGQRVAVDSLRRFQQESERAQQGLTGVWNRLLRHPFFSPPGAGSASNNPFNNASKHLANLGQQARRTGQTVTASFDGGVASLGRLVTAGLAAYAALKTVQGVLGQVERSIAGTAQTGRTAGYAGVSTNFASSLSIGAHVLTNANRQQTEETLFGLRQSIEQVRLGSVDERQQFLARMGINSLDFSKDSEALTREVLSQVSTKFKGMTAPQAQAYGSHLGFQREFTQALQQNPLEHILGVGQPYAATGAQAAELQKLQSALNGVTNAWDVLVREVLVAVSPALRENLKLLDEWIRDNSILIGQDVNTVVREFAGYLREVDWREVGTQLHQVGSGFAAIAGWLKKINEYLDGPVGKLLKWSAGGGVPNMLFPGLTHGLSLLSGDSDTRTPWQRWAPKWLGGRDAPAAGGGGGGGGAGGGGGRSGGGGRGGSIGDTSQTGQGHVATKAERIAFGRQYAISKGLNPDALVATMAGEGLNVYVGDNGTSFGDLQLHVGGGMGDAAIKAGINIRDPNTWKQQLMFGIDRMAENKGNAAWYAGQWHGAPGWAAQQFSNPSAAGGDNGVSPNARWRDHNGRVLSEQEVQARMGGVPRSPPGSFLPIPGRLSAYGDSIAVGVRDAGGLPGDAVGGRKTHEVLAALEANQDKLRGQTAILSSGASNDLNSGLGWRPEIVKQQLELLRKVKAQAVLLGVGSGVKDYQNVNRELAALAKQYNVPFSGELAGTQGGRVHPRDYGAVLAGARALAGNLNPVRAAGAGVGAGSTETNHNYGDVSTGPIIVNTPATKPGEIAGDIARELRRNLHVSNANSPVE